MIPQIKSGRDTSTSTRGTQTTSKASHPTLRIRFTADPSRLDDCACTHCQALKRALVHFVRPFFRSWLSASVIASAEGLGSKPSIIMRLQRGARHCRCSIAIGREPNVLPHAGHCSSVTNSLAIVPWPCARARCACLAFSLVKTRTDALGHSGQNNTLLGNSSTHVFKTSTVWMEGV